MPAMNKKSDIILPFPLAFTFTYRMNEFSQKISFRCTGFNIQGRLTYESTFVSKEEVFGFKDWEHYQKKFTKLV